MPKYLKHCACIIVFSLIAVVCHSQYNRYYFYYVGEKMIIEGHYREAIDVLNVLLKVDSTAYDGYFLRGIAKYNLNDLVGAEEDFTNTIRVNPVYTQAYQYRAVARTMLGNYDDALKDFAEALAIRPDNESIYFSRGVTYFMNHQFDKAVEDFDYFIRKKPYVVDAYVNRGASYLQMKDTTAAFNDYNKAVEINRYDPSGFLRRGIIYLMREQYDSAYVDLSKAIGLDSLNTAAYFNRALAHANNNKPLDAIQDFSTVLKIDSMSSLTYFNRAIVYSQIGDYNKALADYNKVAEYSPGNVLVYYNRGGLNGELGNLKAAESDFTKAIELYPDFANAYLNRSSIRYLLRDEKGAESDKRTAEKKIAEYKAKLSDSTFSAYADTSKVLNKLLSFDPDFGNHDFDNVKSNDIDIRLIPMYRFAMISPGGRTVVRPSERYDNSTVENFIKDNELSAEVLTNREVDLSVEELRRMDETYAEEFAAGGDKTWEDYFRRGVVQYSLKQYTNAIKDYGEAIRLDPGNAFLYMNRSVANAEMIEFVSSLENHRIIIDADPVNRLKNTTRVYSYDEALRDINRAIELAPDIAYFYYNRGNIHCLSGDMPAAIGDYTKAIELYPNFAEAYYNRGLIQIHLKDTRKGCLDISKAGELGIESAYNILQRIR